MEGNSGIGDKERANSIIHLQEEFEPKEDLQCTPVKDPNFDLNSLKQEMRDRHSSQIEREQQIEEILNSSHVNKEEVVPRGLLVETQPDSVFPHEEIEDNTYSVFSCCRRICKYLRIIKV